MFAILGDDLTAVRFNQLTRNGEAKAKPTGRGARAAIKFFEDFVFFARRKTWPVIGHGKDERRIIAGRAHFNWLIARSVGGCVREQSA